METDEEQFRRGARLVVLAGRQSAGTLTADESTELEALEAEFQARSAQHLKELKIRVNAWRAVHGYAPLPLLGPLASGAQVYPTDRPRLVRSRREEEPEPKLEDA